MASHQGDMFRPTDPETSKTAAVAVAVHLNKLQAEVLEAYRFYGKMSARQMERKFPEYGFSTVRKRVSELYKLGLLVTDGTETASGKSPCTVYRLSPHLPQAPE